jgi:hypothetical protein
MMVGHTLATKHDVALRADKLGVFLLFIDLEIQSSSLIGGGSHVTTF